MGIALSKSEGALVSQVPFREAFLIQVWLVGCGEVLLNLVVTPTLFQKIATERKSRCADWRSGHGDIDCPLFDVARRDVALAVVQHPRNIDLADQLACGQSGSPLQRIGVIKLIERVGELALETLVARTGGG